MISSQQAVSVRVGLSARQRVLSVVAFVIVILLLAVVARGELYDSRPPARSLADARQALEGASTVSIVGDSTGNDPDEWVALWAADLGLSRQVELHRWLEGRYLVEPVLFGESGDKLAIWNASQPGGGAAWAADQLDVVQPERPDLVIYSLGHNNTRANVAEQFAQIHGLVRGRWGSVPQVVILQNPSRGSLEQSQAKTRRAIAGWAAKNAVPTIDVTSAFTQPDQLLQDDVHPNPRGSRVWADAVADALN